MREGLLGSDLGKLIPAGTGMNEYRNIRTEAPDFEPMEYYSSSDEDDQDISEWLAEHEHYPWVANLRNAYTELAQFGGPSEDGSHFVKKKPPARVAGDMMAAVRWKQKQKEVKKEWERQHGMARSISAQQQARRQREGNA